MKKLLYFAIVALAAAACAKITELENVNAPAKGNAPVTFGAYNNRITKADIATVNDLDAAGGFGVFAYYTDDETYDQSYLPNFMYNQHVLGDGAVAPALPTWSYAPLKYWPNEYGSTAVSGDVDKISFFAYAPWIDADAVSGKTANYPNGAGILAVSRNREAGDPMVIYKVDTDPFNYENGNLDLLWGVNAGAAWNIKTNPVAPQAGMVAGKPWLDVQRPDDETAQAITFSFRHALSKLSVSVDAYVDGTNLTNAVDANSKIFIREITFSGFALEGALNLNNVTPNEPAWLSADGKHTTQLIDKPITFYDGLRDGSEGAGNLNPNEPNHTALNPDLIQLAALSTGITNAPVNLFSDQTATNPSAVGDPIAVIPTGSPVSVTIVYDVETTDGNLAGFLSDGVTPGSVIENKITKENVFAKLEAGKAYELKLHVGMASVKFDAAVIDWTAGTGSPTDVDVPAN